MSLPILYTFRRCPYAMRARLTLAYAGINCIVREVDLKNKPQTLLDISPKGTVPVLVLADGTIIEQSLEIMEWAVKQSDPAGWMTLSEKQIEFGKLLIETNDSEFIPLLVKYKYFEHYPEASQMAYAEMALPLLAELNLRIAKSGGFVLGNTCSFYDVVIFPFIRQFVKVDPAFFDTLPYLSLKKWLTYFEHLPIFEQIMKKHPVWMPEQLPVLLLD